MSSGEERPAPDPHQELEGVGIAEQGEPHRHIDDAEQHDHPAEDAGEREGEGAQIELKQRAPLRFLIGDVERGEESLRAGRGAPEGEREADEQAPAQRLAGGLDKPANLLDDDVIGLRRQHVGEHAELLLDRGGICRKAIKSDQRGERGKDGEQRKEGAAGGDHREIVAAALGPHPLGDLPPAAQGDVVRPPCVAAIRVWLAAHVLGKVVVEMAKDSRIMLRCRNDFQP